MSLDFNKDGKVDKLDDLNKDGKVDKKDGAQDINKDGKIDKKDDLNKDGKLDWRDKLIQKKNGVLGGAKRELDFNKDGKVDQKDDLNHDGKVDKKDAALAKNGVDKKKDVNGDGKVDQKDDLNHDGKVDQKDAALAKKKKDVNGDGKIDARDKKAQKDLLAANGRHGAKESKSEITKETYEPEVTLVQAFTEAEFYLELRYPLTAPVEGPIDVVWIPATASLDVEFKTASRSNETVGFSKSLTPTKRKDVAGAHYKLKYDNIVTEIGINPEDLPYSFVSGRDADPFVRIIGGTLYIRLALEEGKMAQAVVHMNVNETKKSNTVSDGAKKKQGNGSEDAVYEITVDDALMD